MLLFLQQLQSIRPCTFPSQPKQEGPGSLQSIPNEGARKEPKKLLQRGVRTKKALAPAQYTLQVRAFRELKDAMSLGENLNREGYQSYVVKSEIEGKGLWYRVRIGEFPSLKEATEFQTLFEESEQLSTFCISPVGKGRIHEQTSASPNCLHQSAPIG